MISSEIRKQLQEGLAKLRAITEPTTETDRGISVSYYAEHNSVSTEEKMYKKEDPNQTEFEFEEEEYNLADQTWPYTMLPDIPKSVSRDDMCYASMSGNGLITYDNYNQFYQDIAQAAKEWTDKPSDKKKISQAIEYVLETAKTAPRINNKLTDRLKHDEMMRIVSKLVEYIKD